MRWHTIVGAVVLALSVLFADVAHVNAQFKGKEKAEIDRLRAEIDRLRADLDAATREIAALKAALNGGKATPEPGPLYRGRPVKYWVEELKDLDLKTRETALEAIGTLATKDTKLIPVLADAAKNDKLLYHKAAEALGAAGPDALDSLIDLIKNDQRSRTYAIQAVKHTWPNVKRAVPALADALHTATHRHDLRNTILALYYIGPDAKEATPALVKSLGECLKDAGKPENMSPQIRFGLDPGAPNILILNTLEKIDPTLASEVKLPTTKGVRPSTPAQQDEWRAFHAALLKRYETQK